MLPAGAAHIPRTSSSLLLARLVLKTTFFCLFTDKGAAKIARQLGFDHAEAVVRTPSRPPKLATAILPDPGTGARPASNSGRARRSP